MLVHAGSVPPHAADCHSGSQSCGEASLPFECTKQLKYHMLMLMHACVAWPGHVIPGAPGGGEGHLGALPGGVACLHAAQLGQRAAQLLPKLQGGQGYYCGCLSMVLLQHFCISLQDTVCRPPPTPMQSSCSPSQQAMQCVSAGLLHRHLHGSSNVASSDHLDALNRVCRCCHIGAMPLTASCCAAPSTHASSTPKMQPSMWRSQATR